MRKLATIQLISEILPIPGADNIEVVRINGWKCVSKKNEFNVGDVCIYFEIDSYLPIREEFEFLRKSSYKKMGEEEGFRLKTVRLRKQLSQGLALPRSTFKEIPTEVTIGEDVTELLGVVKYDPPLPACLAGETAGRFPSFIKRTDEERIQNLPNYFKLTDTKFEESIKLDGSSMTVFRTDTSVVNEKTEVIDGVAGLVGVCSRNLELKDNNNNTFWNVANKLKLPEALSILNLEVAIQGELMGPGIQKNREQLKEHKFYVFNIYDIKNSRYLSPADRMEMFTKIKKLCPGIEHVPIVNSSIKIFSELNNFDDVLTYADGKSLNNDKREGLVFKSNTLVDGETISFKVISNKYLLK